MLRYRISARYRRNIGSDVGIDVGDAVGVDVGVDVGVAVGVDVGVDVGVAVGVEVETGRTEFDESSPAPPNVIPAAINDPATIPQIIVPKGGGQI